MREFTAGLSLTENCNYHCGHCYIGQRELWKELHYKPKEMSLHSFKVLLPELVDANVTRINFGGGESALHPDFLRIVELLYSAQIKMSLTTNGSTMKKIRNHLGLFNDVGVSLDFADERHNSFRGYKNAFGFAVDALEELVSKGVPSEMVTCIMRPNYDNLQELYELAQCLGVDMWRLNRYHPTKNDLKRFDEGSCSDGKLNTEYLACSPAQMSEAFLFLASLPRVDKPYATTDPVFRQLISGYSVTNGLPNGRVSLRIKTNGDVLANTFIDEPLGNVFRERLTDILHRDEYEKYGRSAGMKCLECKNYENCEGGDFTDALLTNVKVDPYCFLDTNKKSEAKLMKLEDTHFVHESYIGTIYVPILWGRT